jgi:23S rRNA pseudouridine1911/1915/1917 synthase
MRRSNTDLEVLYEDNHLIIINKCPGDIVQGDKTGDIPLSEIVKDYLKKRYNKPGAVFLGVVHRLDRPVSGAVIFARTSKALSRLNAMLKEGTIQKTYLAVVKNPPPNSGGHLVHYLTRDEARNRSFAHENPVKISQRAELTYQVIAHSKTYYLLLVNLLTGRHHQIRSQLSAIGCPIRGDLKYGYPRTNADGSIHLHAVKIEFIHPVSKEIVVVTAPYPKDAVWDAFKDVEAIYDTIPAS